MPGFLHGVWTKFRAERWQFSNIPDLTGRVAIVTGGNQGIGLITVHELAKKGAIVYMLSRSESRAHAAIDSIKKDSPSAQVKFISFDMTSVSSCKQAAQEFLSKEQRLDILVNNAGITNTPTYTLSPDGVEIVACNGTGPFALTIPLLPILKSSAALPESHVRIINVSSDSHYSATLDDFTSVDKMNDKKIGPLMKYNNSKLMNVLFNDKLQEKLEGTGIRCISIHPGFVATDINTSFTDRYPILKPIVALLHLLALTPEEGAMTSLYAATSPDVDAKDLKAVYLIPFGEVVPKSALAENTKLRDQFWELCEKVTGETA